MAINSKQKGKRGELELTHILKDYGYSARRGQQYCGINGDADVVGLPGIYIECKWVEHLNVRDALDQALNDSQGTGALPAVFHKKNRKPWLVTMRMDDWLRLYKDAGWGDE